MIDDFKKQLNKLLLKFPELPEFTLTVRPRVSIEFSKTTTSVGSTPINSIPIIPPAVPTSSKSEPVDLADRGLLLEKSVTPELITKLKGFNKEN